VRHCPGQGAKGSAGKAKSRFRLIHDPTQAPQGGPGLFPLSQAVLGQGQESQARARRIRSAATTDTRPGQQGAGQRGAVKGWSRDHLLVLVTSFKSSHGPHTIVACQPHAFVGIDPFAQGSSECLLVNRLHVVTPALS
jgi:hypothetical protein